MSYSGTVRCSYCYERGHNKRSCPTLNQRLRRSYLEAKENLAQCEANGDGAGALTYRLRMEHNGRQYTKRTRCNPDTGASIVMTKAQKAEAKIERMKNIKCSYCCQHGHTRRTCSVLKEDQQVFIKAAQMVRAQRLKEMRDVGAGIGSMAVMNRYGYWGDNRQWGSRARPMMLTKFHWAECLPNHDKSLSMYGFQDAATLKDGFETSDYYATTKESTYGINGLVREEKITLVGKIEPPAGWLEAADLKFNRHYPSGKARDWTFRDAEDVVKHGHDSSRYSTNDFIEARRSLDL